MKQNLTPGNPYRKADHYQYPQDILDCHLDMVEELRTKAKDVRASIHIGKPTSGNAAAAKLELAMGRVYSEEATSKRKPLNIPGLDNGPKLCFPERIDRAAASENYNEKHAEYKLFNALAAELERDSVPSDATGTLYLYTRLNMCSGCYTTCNEDFARWFPNIEVIIFYEEPYP